MSLTTPLSVQKLQTALHAKAKENPACRFHALYDKVYRSDVLAHAYACCRANKGAAGVCAALGTMPSSKPTWRRVTKWAIYGNKVCLRERIRDPGSQTKSTEYPMSHAIHRHASVRRYASVPRHSPITSSFPRRRESISDGKKLLRLYARQRSQRNVIHWRYLGFSQTYMGAPRRASGWVYKKI